MTQPHNNEIAIRLSRGARFSAIIGIAAMMIIVIAFSIYIFAIRKPFLVVPTDSSDLQDWVGYSMSLAMFPIIWLVSIYSIYKIAKRGWFGTSFYVSEKGIRQEYPNGTKTEGAWGSLKYVSPARKMLVFDDGKRVVLSFGWGALEDTNIKTILSASGEESLLSKAFLEYENADLTKRDRRRYGMAGFAIMGLMMGLAYLSGSVESFAWRQIAYGCFLLCSVAVVILAMRLKRAQRLVERKYGPPKKEHWLKDR